MADTGLAGSVTGEYKSPVHSKLIAGASLVLIAGWLIWFGINDPAMMPGWFRCPSISLFGVYCPGCGSTRGTHALLRMDPIAAARYNPALIVLGIPALIGTVWACLRTLRNDPKPVVTGPAWVAWSLLALLIGYTVARNLPFEQLDVLRPPAHLDGAAPDSISDPNISAANR